MGCVYEEGIFEKTGKVEACGCPLCPYKTTKCVEVKPSHYNHLNKRREKMTNKEFSKVNEVFLKACELAQIKPTVRQASKFRFASDQKILRGRASWFRKQAIEIVEEKHRESENN